MEASQLPAIFSQHSRCSAVISLACARQVESGRANSTIARATDANWDVLFNISILRLPPNHWVVTVYQRNPGNCQSDGWRHTSIRSLRRPSRPIDSRGGRHLGTSTRAFYCFCSSALAMSSCNAASASASLASSFTSSANFWQWLAPWPNMFPCFDSIAGKGCVCP
jgi:hypothetical protein